LVMAPEKLEGVVLADEELEEGDVEDATEALLLPVVEAEIEAEDVADPLLKVDAEDEVVDDVAAIAKLLLEEYTWLIFVMFTASKV